jgi:amidohydrolase
VIDFDAIKTEAQALRPWLVDLRRTFHRHPELGREENFTADYIGARLEELGVEYTRIGTAIVGLVRGANSGRTVALRADIDALPIQEETGAEYASTRGGIMHACGHDAHATILLGAARWFSEHRARLEGNVKLLFQPAEESDGGAEQMIQDGCMENPHVDSVIGLHVMPYLPVGRIETKKGALNGSSSSLNVTVRGVSCHAAYPERGVDAIMITAHVVTALHSLVSRYVSPLESAVLTIGTIHGGTVSNIIADEVTMKATLRTTGDATRDLLVDKVRAIVENVAASFGGSGSVDVKYGYTALINDAAVVEVLAATAEELLGPGSVEWKEKPSMGVEDFSFFCKARPGAFYHLGCGNEARGITAPLHASTFDIDEDCLPTGVALQVATTLRLLEKDFV